LKQKSETKKVGTKKVETKKAEVKNRLQKPLQRKKTNIKINIGL
jgi:hypothetical protein